MRLKLKNSSKKAFLNGGMRLMGYPPSLTIPFLWFAILQRNLILKMAW